ncbi:MAG: tetratricopeptide repeat protein [Deltaproteobacteria bacterium]|nr:tetratricopeptide repeat protein [Deltaproteobacteria bacterium]
MKLKKIFFFVSLAFFAIILVDCSASKNKEEQWEQLATNAAEFTDRKQYDDAMRAWKLALQFAEGNFSSGHEAITVSNENLADIYRINGNLNKAEELLIRALGNEEKRLGANHPDVGIALNNLGAVYVEQKKYSEAEEALKRSIQLLERAQAPQLLITAFYSLADCYQAQGRYTEAEPFFKRVLESDKEEYEKDKAEENLISLTIDLLALAKNYVLQREYNQAKELYQKALKIAPNDSDVAEAIKKLADVYKKQGFDKEASLLYEKIGMSSR